MATRAFDPAYRPVTVREFLEMNLGEAKAELVDGQIMMMAGGSARHAAIAANLIIALGPRLRGTGCRPFGSDLAMQTGEASIRFPDVSVYCGDLPEDISVKLLGDPKVVFEVLSPSTASNDQITKLAEYRIRIGVEAVVFVDPAHERVRLVDCRDVAGRDADWLPVGGDLAIPMLNITIPHAEIFARD